MGQRGGTVGTLSAGLPQICSTSNPSELRAFGQRCGAFRHRAQGCRLHGPRLHGCRLQIAGLQAAGFSCRLRCFRMQVAGEWQLTTATFLPLSCHFPATGPGPVSVSKWLADSCHFPATFLPLSCHFPATGPGTVSVSKWLLAGCRLQAADFRYQLISERL